MSNKYCSIVLFTALSLLLFSIPGKAAEPPRFAFPLTCKLGETCWPANYVDMDSKEGEAKDFTCSPRAYDVHNGTDFALRSEAEMQVGVNVLAALDGTVLRLRDGETDTLKAQSDLDKIRKENKDCGNGVYLDHAKAGYPGLSTIYCHMKQGSISVKQGESVKAGDVLGQVGQSGYAEFPHLHFGIVWEGAVMEPYSGLNTADSCGGFKRKLWKDEAMEYVPVSLYDGGFQGKSAQPFHHLRSPGLLGRNSGGAGGRSDQLERHRSLWRGIRAARHCPRQNPRPPILFHRPQAGWQDGSNRYL